jgi:uncharacterized protein (TIGR03435 family)
MFEVSSPNENHVRRISMRSICILLAALSAALLSAQAPPSFEVATVRPTAGAIPGVPAFLGQQKTTPDTLTARNTGLLELIQRAYAITTQEITGVPDWVRDARYDLIGKSAQPASDAELWSMVQPLLEDRFKFKYHHEPREVSGLAIVVGKNGPKLTASEGGSNAIAFSNGVLTGSNVPILRLAQILSSVLRVPVKDATGLEGTYNFSIKPAKYASDAKGVQGLQSMLITAIQEELGLKLESRKFEVQVMVIDHIEQPGEN